MILALGKRFRVRFSGGILTNIWVCGLVVRIDAFQALGSGSIPGKLKRILRKKFLQMNFFHCSKKKIDFFLKLLKPIVRYYKQSGAVEACLSHNQEVDGSKPSSATLNKPMPPW